ncbi:MAG: hypothetical protein IPK19_21125 [Chloroflexi bacterium]|nr:hypothetical protein [Chloroflexota bacterium]
MSMIASQKSGMEKNKIERLLRALSSSVLRRTAEITLRGMATTHDEQQCRKRDRQRIRKLLQSATMPGWRAAMERPKFP